MVNFFQRGKFIFKVMEYVSGGDLYSLLKNLGIFVFEYF